MKPTLLILAAGMGSRYGGLKQLDRFGPDGENILDYSVFDAIRAGFGKIVFVIRRDIEAAFKKQVVSRFEDKIEIVYAFQELDMLPEGCIPPKDRVKPWGTGHAVMVAKDVINEPFGTINADDFYGMDSFQKLADFLTTPAECQKLPLCMVGYLLKNTLSEHGTVSRGICSTDENSLLENVVERTRIKRTPEGPAHFEENGDKLLLRDEDIVSMNFFGFTPGIFDLMNDQFRTFIAEKGQDLKSEFFLPASINRMIKKGQATVTVLPTSETWFGVTYPEDKEMSQAQINKRISKGIYPERLWR